MKTNEESNPIISRKISSRELEKLRRNNDEIDTILGYIRFVMDENNLEKMLVHTPEPWSSCDPSLRNGWIHLMRGHFWHILSGLVFERRFPEDMTYSLFEVLRKEGLSKIQLIENPYKELPEIFVRIYDLKSPVRSCTWGLASILRIYRDCESGKNNFVVDVKKYFKWIDAKQTLRKD